MRTILAVLIVGVSLGVQARPTEWERKQRERAEAEKAAIEEQKFRKHPKLAAETAVKDIGRGKAVIISEATVDETKTTPDGVFVAITRVDYAFAVASGVAPKGYDGVKVAYVRFRIDATAAVELQGGNVIKLAGKTLRFYVGANGRYFVDLDAVSWSLVRDAPLPSLRGFSGGI